MKKEILYSLAYFKESLLKNFKNRPSVTRLLPPPAGSGWVASFDETQIYYEVHGNLQSPTSPPIAMCYGLVCSMNQWRKQVERFCRNRPVILFDYRGHHKSETPSETQHINISALAKDLSAVLNHLKLTQPIHIWGHSMGVSVAIEFAVQEPSRVQSLVLCCGSPSNPFANMFDSDVLEKVMKPLLGAYPKNTQIFESVWRLFLAEPRMAEWISMIAGFNAKASDRKDIQVYANAVASVEPRVFFSLLSDLAKGMTQNILPQVKSPALIIAGAQDHVTPISVQKKLAQQLKNSEYAEIPLGSHNVQLDFGEYVGLKAEEFWEIRNLDSPSSISSGAVSQATDPAKKAKKQRKKKSS